jgi:hypothetical protein
MQVPEFSFGFSLSSTRMDTRVLMKKDPITP